METRLLNKINSFILKDCGLNSQSTILVAVSGGMDSMALADILHKLGFRICLAHCNFQLRKQDSFLDEELVKSWSSEKEITSALKRFDTLAISKETKKGIQETARNLRYEWFEMMRQTKGLDFIATAHHQDDQAETILAHLIRGSGLQGVMGMPAVSNFIIRPLLEISKQEIREYINTNKIPFREDSSNDETHYTRNKIRHFILPELKKINNQVVRNLAHFGQHIRNLSPRLNEWRNEELNTDPTGLPSASRLHIPDHPWNPSEIYLLISPYGFNSTQAINISEAILNKSKGKGFYSPKFLITIGHEELIISQNTKYISPLFEKIKALPYKICFENISMTIQETPDNSSDLMAKLDFSKISWPLVLRRWQFGDRIRLSGMKGKSKKLQDYFTDLKISTAEKETALILTSNDNIIWVWPGNRISENVKPNEKTEKYLYIQIKSNHLSK